MKKLMLLVVGCLACLPVRLLWAEEVNIGHLETNDDTGINWLFLQCNKTAANASEMTCSFLQTLIMRKRPEQEIQHNLSLQVDGDAVANFDRDFGAVCKPMLDGEPQFRQAMKTGIGANGKKMDPRMVGPGEVFMTGILDVCKNKTRNNVVAFANKLAYQDRKTCKVHNAISQSTFRFNVQKSNWGTQEGPTGACGTYTIGTLSQDPKNHFWSYVEKAIRTNPQGVLPNGLACSQLPEHTLNYTWKTTTTMENCTFMESMPD